MRYLVLGEKRYPIDHVYDDVSLGRLRKVARATGLSLLDIQAQVERIDGKMTPDQIIRDADLLDGLAAFVWLARTTAGEDITLDEAAKFEFTDLNFAEDAPVEAVPTQAATGSSPVAAKPSTRRTSAGGGRSRAATSRKP